MKIGIRRERNSTDQKLNEHNQRSLQTARTLAAGAPQRLHEMKTLHAMTALCLVCGITGCSTTGTAPKTAVYNTRQVYAQTEAPIITALAGGRAKLEQETKKSLSVNERELFDDGPTGRTSMVQHLFEVQTPLVRAAAERLLGRGYTTVVPCNLDGNAPAGQWVDVTEEMVRMVEDLIKENANDLLDAYHPKAGNGLWHNGQQ